MNTFEMAKKNYDKGLWTDDMLKALVKKTQLNFTAEDYMKITGKEYVA